MISLNEDTYDEINAELQRMAAIQAAEEEVSTKRLFIGSGEDVFLFHWKDIEHHGN